MKEGNKKKTQQKLEAENKKPPQSKLKEDELEDSNIITKVHINRKAEPNSLLTSKEVTKEEETKCPHEDKDKSQTGEDTSGKILVEIK